MPGKCSYKLANPHGHHSKLFDALKGGRFVTQASIVELAEVCETQSQNGLMSDGTEASHGRRGESMDASAGRCRGPPADRGPGQRIRLGCRRRVTGTVDKAAASYEIERNIYDAASSAAQRPPPAVDLLELYAGTAKPTKFA